ncbi:superoxide dismutase [Candidatus Uhrbacteria bacterium CG10_big_fil_rev_8_21_14_0_10_48_11]|uniref:superoxide dismutase n=1 Tax=Candidatus Uhrbacteria bacterium CG10_big_fil_rev_8_21_14_0_10_48_11 TaxID=1975037 RepID=A0A2M8LF67_9BACT|nr:MAG: superoxide dismutase [Candidatus Uhrbacteria bacterium CG10_big_fil_rev_8_21_14_0_10_48_11]
MAKTYEGKPLPFKTTLKGISDKTIAMHHDVLYMGYVKKKNEIAVALKGFEKGEKDLAGANQTYSELRGLKDGETFATNGVYLHEYYFNVLGGDGEASGPLVDAIGAKYGSLENFLAYFNACGMAARGWAVLAWDTHEAELKVYTGDAHNQGGVWGAIPVLTLDVYEHAYFIDYGSDRKSYIDDYIKNLNWKMATLVFEAAQKVKRVD